MFLQRSFRVLLSVCVLCSSKFVTLNLVSSWIEQIVIGQQLHTALYLVERRGVQSQEVLGSQNKQTVLRG